MQVVGGADDGAGGERFVGTGEPIEVPSSDAEPVRRRPLDERLGAGVHRRRAGLLRLISGMAVELHDLDELRRYVDEHRSLDGVVVKDIDLTPSTAT